MTAIISVFFAIIVLWTGHGASWMVDYATGLAQLGIWSTLFSLQPFLSIWVSLKQSVFTEISRTLLHTHWSAFLKVSNK